MLENTDCAIIAGGKSLRFGSNKAYAELKGKKLIDYALDLAQEISTKVIIVYAQNKPSLSNDSLANLIWTQDQFSEKGPLAGIHAALLQSTAMWLAVIPCDMPYLNDKIYLNLADHRKGTEIVVAKSSNGLEPLVSLWHKNNIGRIESLLEDNQGKHGLKDYIENNAAKIIDLTLKHQHFKNINYPTDLT